MISGEEMGTLFTIIIMGGIPFATLPLVLLFFIKLFFKKIYE